MSHKIADALERVPKLLLTATPLQNSLMELYGLVSVIDEHVFADSASFREQFVRISNDALRNQELKQRLDPICIRTLRKQVMEYVPFTRRVPITQEFLPSDARTPIPDGEKNRIGSMLFGGFQKCLYPEQKFDSDPERRFAVILENDEDVLKWFKPAKGDFQIHYSHDQSYEPDFVVETASAKFLCEPKRASEVSDDVVQSKADAAAVWCEHATVHARTYDGKPWTYLLIPHDQIAEQMSLAGLAAGSTYKSQGQETGSRGRE